jgi:polyamine oxidase
VQTVATDYDEVAKLAVDPRLQPLDYQEKTWRRFVERARDEVDGGSLGSAVEAAATSEELSGSERAQLAYYVNTEIEDEYAADASQLSAAGDVGAMVHHADRRRPDCVGFQRR